MHLWIVNPFDPLPGEEEQLGRYGTLADLALARGHRVTWWSSTFSHRFKRPIRAEKVAAAARERGLAVRLVEAPPYQKNISVRRLRNHTVLGQRFVAEATTQPPPDLILASSPPLEMARHAMQLSRDWGRPGVLDIQDLWPQTFVRALPAPLAACEKTLFAPYYRMERAACQAASAIVGVAKGYRDRGLEVGGEKRHHGIFSLGVNLDELRTAMQRGRERFLSRWQKPEGQRWMLYSGSLSYSYDVLTLLRAAAAIEAQHGESVRLILTGQGELLQPARDLAAELGLRQTTLTGFLDFEEWACILSQADIGLNANVPESLTFLPGKIFSYFGAGTAIINTVPGECADLIAESGCGVSYRAGDVEGCRQAMQSLLQNPDALESMRQASRRLGEEVFDRGLVYANFLNFLEQVAETASENASRSKF